MPRTLRELLRQGPLDSSTARHVLRQVLQALTLVHRREIDCGPITPESVVDGEAPSFLLSCPTGLS